MSLPALQAADGARDAAAASDGSGWLVAWTRTSLIAAARVDAEGNVNDPAGMIIATPDGGQVSHPAVAFGGNHYLVAWTTYRSMRARLIGADGELSPAVEIGTVSGGAGIAMAVHAASDGSHFLVAWSEWIAVGTYQRRAVVLDMNANAVASVTLNADESSVDFAISAGNGEFAIFDGLHDSSSGTFVRAFRIDDAGRSTGPISIDHSPAPLFYFSPRAAFDGTEHLVLWSTNERTIPTGPGQSLGARLSLDNRVTPVAPFDSGNDAVDSVTWNGLRYVVMLSDRHQHLDSITLDASGLAMSPLAPVVVADISAVTLSSVAAWNGSKLLATVEDGRHVFAKFLDRGGPIGDPANKGIPVALSPADQQSPSIASANGTDSLAVWLEDRPETGSPFVTVMPLRNGTPAAEQPIVLAADLFYQFAPVVASDGSEYLVVWWHIQQGLLGQRLDLQGRPIDASPFVIRTPFFGKPAVAFDGENFVVAQGCTITRVSPAGIVLDAKPISVGAADKCYAFSQSLTAGSNGSLLTWIDATGPTVAVISRAAASSGPIKLPLSGNTPFLAAWTGSSFIVMHAASHGAEWVVLDENGIPQQSVPFTVPGNLIPSSGTRFGNGALFVLSDGHDLFGLRLAADGLAIGAPFLISGTEFEETAAAIAGDATGRAIVVYERTVDLPSVPGLMRLFVREIGAIPPPPRKRAT